MSGRLAAGTVFEKYFRNLLRTLQNEREIEQADRLQERSRRSLIDARRVVTRKGVNPHVEMRRMQSVGDCGASGFYLDCEISDPRGRIVF
jgi:hypothetical protein